MSAEQKSKKIPLISDAIIIAVATLFGYTLAYMYEFGYAKATGIPNYLIDVSISKILIACFAIFIPALALLNIFYGWYRRGVEADKSSWKVLLLRYWPMAALATAACLIFRFKWAEVAPYLIFAISMAITTQLFAFYKAAKRSPHPKNLEQNLNNKSSTPLIDPLIKEFGVGAFWLAIAIAILFSIAYMTGRAEYLFQKQYLVPKSQKSLVLLRVYGDKIILRGINREDLSFTNEIQIRKIGDQNTLSFEKEQLGPLSYRK